MTTAGVLDRERAVVLVVDDDPAVRHALRLVLDDEFETVEASGGYEALRRLRAGRFDAVLLDVLLPDVDGLEVLRQLRRGAAPPPVVVVTGVAVVRTAVEAMKLGAVDYVSKPFAPDDLLLAVRVAVSRGRAASSEPRLAPPQAPAAVVGGEPAAQVALALLLDAAVPVERFSLLAPELRTRELACAVVLAGRGADVAAAKAILDSLAGRTAVFVATTEPWPARGAATIGPGRVFAPGDWSGLATAVRAHLGGDLPRIGRHVGQAVGYIAAHHGRALSVGDIAGAIGVSESHLAHLFPVETGFTVRRFLGALRLELAREDVARGEDKLQTIARRFVFADGPHLSRALHRTTGRRAGAANVTVEPAVSEARAAGRRREA